MKNNLRRLQLIYTFISSVIILSVSFCISAFILAQTNSSMKKQVSSLIAADTHQLEMNVNNYLNEVEKITTLLFSDEAYYLYDATDASISDYDKILAADVIKEKIVDLGLMRNFSDFGVVYTDDTTIGWISQVTKAQFANGGLYDEFSPITLSSVKEHGWTYGIKDNYDRLYYVKRLNPHAIILVSFYGSELENAFDIPGELSDMTIRLSSQDNTILYSSDSSEISQPVPDELLTRLDGRSGISIMDDEYLVTANQVANGWNIICSIPTKAVLKDNEQVRSNLLVIVVLVAAIALISMLLVSRRMNRSMSGMVEDLSDKASEDQMTKLLNRTSFMNNVTASLSTMDSSRHACFIMFDLDNFKMVNDTLGHSKGDEVLIRMSDFMREYLTDENILLSRVGGDEFAAFLTCGGDRKEIEDHVREEVQAMIDAFHAYASSLDESIPLSVSAGILITGLDTHGAHTADDLYQKADAGLYVSKRGGKSQLTIL